MIYDISYCQAGLKLDRLPDCEKVIIRLGVRDHIDTNAIDFIKQAIELNIPFELYWYIMCANASAAAVESKYIIQFYNMIKNRFTIYPFLWLDIEDNAQLKAFNIIYPVLLDKLNKVNIKNGLYTFKSAFENYINLNAAYMYKREIWLAWHNTKIDSGTVKAISPNIRYWQYGKTTIDNKEVDVNIDISEYKVSIVEKLKIDCVRLFTASTGIKYVKTNMPLWRYDKAIINGRVRVTNSKDNIGRLPLSKYVTGWVYLEDLQNYGNYRK